MSETKPEQLVCRECKELFDPFNARIDETKLARSIRKARVCSKRCYHRLPVLPSWRYKHKQPVKAKNRAERRRKARADRIVGRQVDKLKANMDKFAKLADDIKAKAEAESEEKQA